ncbi:hypothetical protein FSP39_014132 [Pinctada imbricata]|uniref:Serine/threonine-protein kinase ULK3 n=1 Tax=Pinctada imbricata TaxID=66713 RepID=A0AA88YEZ6_PINIB|nr:hypothetical protein FSP39_014132 [Pinctada imbricata]
MANSKNSTLPTRPKTAHSVDPKPSLKNYVFTDKLGSGTYATVYKAFKRWGNRQSVAIKCVKKNSLNKASTENLLTEIGLLKKLNHPHIVTLYDFLWDDFYIYIIMEYCSGGDLSQFIRSKRSLPEYIVKRFLQQLVKAMMYLRSHNVAHMDLKPQNILLTAPPNTRLKIGDFGFAKHVDLNDELHIMRGSPLYMAPEIICKGKYDPRVDIWSIGVIMYECLFGRAPFASKSLKELQEKIWDSKPVEIPYGVSISDQCRDLLLKILRRDPDERITFDEFFHHPFVDLEHSPSKDCLTKAIDMVKEAVQNDEKGDYKKAVKLYCESLEYFVPAIRHEENEVKKEALRKRVHDYMKRAEELKLLMKPKRPPPPVRSSSQPEEPNDIDELLSLAEQDDELVAAIKVLKAAEKESEKEDYEKAMTHYELGLNSIIKFIKTEEDGRRKSLMSKLAAKGMDDAEKIKAFLDVKDLKTEETQPKEEDANDSVSSEKCVIQ